MADDRSSCVHDAEAIRLSIMESYPDRAYSGLSGCDSIINSRLH
jgi:hypothetical protein